MENWVKLLLIIIILVVVISLDLILYLKTDKLIEYMQETLGKLEAQIIEEKAKVGEDKAKLKRQAEKIRNEWEKDESILSFFIEHEEVEKVSVKIEVVRENIENQEYEVALEDIAETRFLLQHIQDKYNLTLRNLI